MKKGDIIQVKISGINSRFKSFGYFEGKKVFVNINVAIDQIVEGMITKIKKDNIYIHNNKIIDYANRVNTMQEDIDKQLPGANLQYYTYEEQLNIKNDIVKSFLGDILEKPIKSIDKIKYRNKMEFSFGNEYINGPTILGLHKQNSMHDIVDVSNNKLMDDNFNKIYIFTNIFFKEKKLEFYHRIKHEGLLRNLVIRKSEKNKQIIINLVTTSYKKIDEVLEEYKNKLLSLKLNDDYKITGILHTINDNISDMVNSEKEIILYGNRDIEEIVLDLNFKISPYSFFQTNSKTVELLYSKVIEYVNIVNNKNYVVFDLFSGTGTISQILSKHVKEVYGIEIIEEAVVKAKENAKLNNLDNCHFISGDVFEKLDNLDIKPDLLILDPPRAGVLEKNIDKIVKYNVKNIVYISCNPISLEKDLKYFENYGYLPIKACIVDMFPFTKHVETIALIQRVKS